MDKISVITVCFNAELTIDNAIKSVLGQTYPFIEYILIDGKSTDNTNYIIESYRDDFLKRGIDFYHISELDAGIYDAMNKGIELAKGNWINFLNSDDEYFNENVLTNVFSGTYEGIDCVYGDTVNVLQGKTYYRKSFDIKVLSYRNPYVHQALFVRRDTIKKYMFDIQYQYAADFDQAVRMYKGNVTFKHIALPVCRFSLEGRSQKNNNVTVKEYEIIRKRNGIRNNRIIRYLIYFIVLIIKQNNFFYGLYVSVQRMRKSSNESCTN